MASLAFAQRLTVNTSLRATIHKIVGAKAAFSSLTPDKTHYVQSRKPASYALGKHRSNALELVQKQPIIEVDGDMAVCDGGGGALGHPLEYIKVGARADLTPEEEALGIPCIYCGLRYRKKKGGH